MTSKLLLILLAGLFALWSGCRSVGGYESDVEMTRAGETVTIICDGDGNPIDGPGFLTAPAEEACSEKRSDQRGRAPWWMLGGAVLLGYGVHQFRKA